MEYKYWLALAYLFSIFVVAWGIMVIAMAASIWEAITGGALAGMGFHWIVKLQKES